MTSENQPSTEMTVGESLSLQSVTPSSSQIRRDILLGSSFCVLFTGFLVAQLFTTTLHPDDGFISLALMYGSFGLFSIVARYLAALTGMRMGFLVAALTYVSFIAVLNQPLQWLFLLTSIVNGFGAALLWVLQGIWLTQLNEENGGDTAGYLTGLFAGLFGLADVIGNVIALVVLSTGASPNMMIWIMFGVALLGAFMIGFTSNINIHGREKEETLVAKHNFRDDCKAFIASFKDLRIQLLIPLIIFEGVTLAFAVGSFPILIGTPLGIPQAFLVYGVCSCLGSYVCGLLFDRWRYIPLIVISIFSVLLNLSLLFLLIYGPSQISDRGIIFSSNAMLFALTQCASNSLINVRFIHHHGENAAEVFSLYWSCFCIGFFFTSALATGVSVTILLCWYFASFAAALICYCILERRTPVRTPSGIKLPVNNSVGSNALCSMENREEVEQQLTDLDNHFRFTSNSGNTDHDQLQMISFMYTLDREKL